jgi:hypothetical protein
MRGFIFPDSVRSDVFEAIWSGVKDDRSRAEGEEVGEGDLRPDDLAELNADQASTAEAFAAVGSDLRLSILRVLCDNGEPLSFSALHDRAGIGDSAQFNYHLQKLVPRFVGKGENGYYATLAGQYVVSAIVTGTFTSRTIGPFPAGGPCVACGGDLCARYGDDFLPIWCEECDKIHSMWNFPPGGLIGRDQDELLDAYDQWVRHTFDMAISGVCSICGGRMVTKLSLDLEPHPPGDTREAPERDDNANMSVVDSDVLVTYRCQQCHQRAFSYPGFVLLTDPAVQAFYRNHGQSLEEIRYWTLPWAVDNSPVEIVSESPPRVRIRIHLDGEELAVTLDESLTVVETERTLREV